MKKRDSFVSNSSSCSFVIHKSQLTPEKIEEFKKFRWDEEDDGDEDTYSFTETKNYFYGSGEALYNSSRFFKMLRDLKLKEDDDFIMENH